jgi:hypothetical protein
MDEDARSLESGALISGLRSRVPNFACEFSISVGDLARDGRLLGFEAVLDDTRLVLTVVDGFATGRAGIGDGFSSLSFAEVVGIVECRRRGAASPRMKFICALSSELDSYSLSCSSFMLSGRDIEESPDVDCCRSRLEAEFGDKLAQMHGNIEELTWRNRCLPAHAFLRAILSRLKTEECLGISKLLWKRQAVAHLIQVPRFHLAATSAHSHRASPTWHSSVIAHFRSSAVYG